MVIQYTAYAPETDMTFIMEDSYAADGRTIIATSVVGWYRGKERDCLTEAYAGQLTHACNLAFFKSLRPAG